MTVNEILEKYTTGDMPLDEANEALAKETEGMLQLDPNRNVITQEEFLATTAGDTPDNGKTVDVNMGEEFALVYIAGKCYELRGDTLVEPEK